MNSSRLKGIFTLVCLTCASALFAQTGIIRGKVIEVATGEPLLFTNVIVQNTDPLVGEQTDYDGNYQIEIAAGTYSLEVTYVGYATKIITDVVVEDGKVAVVDFLMEDETEQLVEVVVTAAKVDRTENALLAIQRKALGIQDGISAQEISRYGGGNAAESMKRVTGASVVGGKYIYVRGLGDRYSTAQLNGTLLPSNDPYRNSTQLDLIPANLLDNIIATKTFLPDQPGSATGGNVNIKTKSFPERFTLSAGVSASFNTIGSLNDNFLTYDGGNTDWLGFDDGTRAIPDEFNNEELLEVLELRRFNIQRAVDEDKDFADLFNQASEALNPQKDPIIKRSGFNHGVNFSIGNQIDVGGNPLGFLFGVNYNRGFSAYENADLNFWQVSQSQAGSLLTVYDFEETKGTENATLGGLMNLSYKFGRNNANKISFNLLYNNDSEKTARDIIGLFPDRVSGVNIFESRVLYWNERQMVSYQLLGEHTLTDGGIKVEWAGSFVDSKQEEPDMRIFQNTFRVRDSEPFDTLYGIDPAEFQLPFHFFRNLKDQQTLAKIDFTIPFLQGQSRANKIKVGGLYSLKEREFSNDLFQFSDESAFEEIYRGDPIQYFGPDNVGIIGFNENTNRNVLGLYPTNQERATLKNNYTGEEGVYAAYAMATYDIGKFRVIGGARMEVTDITVQSQDTSFAVGDIQEVDFLPSLNLVYRINDNMNIRASYTQTLARPNMRELAPFSSFDRGTDFQVTGNSNLERTSITNYDLRWEWFPSPGEVFAVSGYYKDFSQPIIKRFDIRSPNREIIFDFVDNAVVYGVEFEIRKNLGFITEALENLRFITNLSFIVSEVDIPGDPEDINTEQGNIAAFNPDKGFTRPFEGQSPFLVNAALNYLNPDIGLDAIISLNVFGERLTLNNQGADPDFFQQPMPDLDLSIRKTFGKDARYGVKLTMQNLLNTDYNESINFQGEEFVIQRYERGRTFGLSLSYNIR
ncbi:MAG: TonB-dependent receptor [Bacteroidota bacterium]